MNLYSSSLKFSKRRGLSSIVGALIFVVLMVAAFAVLGVAMDTQTDIVDVNRDVADTGLKKQQENFVINRIVQNNADYLEIHVTNKAQNPTEIFTMVITNSSDSVGGFPTKTYDIPYDTSFLPPFADQPTNILEGANLKMDITADGIDEKYDIKLISSLGNVQTYNIICNDTSCGLSTSNPGTGGLDIQLLLDGATGVNTKTTTVLMFVTNTGNGTVTGVTPIEGCSTTPNILSSINGVAYTGTFPDCDFQSPDPIDLLPGQTGFFKWDGTVSGDIDDVLTFCNTAKGDSVPAPVEECDTLTIIDPNDCGGCEGGGDGGETIILIDDLLIRPSLFMIIPSPFGDTENIGSIEYRGLWGVNVANPTDVDMDVSKLTIVAYPPGGDKSDNVFSGIKGTSAGWCKEVAISPTTGWDCPRDNTLMWQNITNPVTVPANSTKSFMVKVEPYNLAGDFNLDAIIVQANIFSSLGSFGKSGYQSTMYKEASPLVNVYLSDETDLRTGFTSDRINIPENSTQTFSVVLADLDDDPDTHINEETDLIINVPREWEFVEFVSHVGFNTPTNVTHSDGSTQLVAETNTIIGDGSADPTPGVDARKVVFKAKAPDVDFHRLYIMYILADGTVDVKTGSSSTELKTIGPLNEVVLQVNP
jgi:hypothetical protein